MSVNSTKRAYVGYSWFFKGFLILGMLIVIALFIYFNLSIVAEIRHDASKMSEAYAHLIQFGAGEATDQEIVGYIFDNIITKVNFPIVVTDRHGIPTAWTVDISPLNITQKDRLKLEEYTREFDNQNQPIEIKAGNEVISILHYGDSYLIKRLQLIPIIEISVVGFFILFAFVGIRNIQQAEQRSIWVGMAKETAHQLGTPLSSLFGWVELLQLKHQEGKIIYNEDAQEATFDEMTQKMTSDLRRLERIAIRFGQIGSMPELELCDVNSVIKETVTYFRHRMSTGGITLIDQYEDLPKIKINPELMSWVIENLLKNSLEATNPKTGIINITTIYNKGRNRICIIVEDNGRGIPVTEHNKIFAPGFTTKKRGWGLGLTLAKRIVEEYHGGKIILRTSEPNIKTIFLIEMPV